MGVRGIECPYNTGETGYGIIDGMDERGMTETERELRGRLAELAHRQWSGWMGDVLGRSLVMRDGAIKIPHRIVEGWRRQMKASYGELTEEERVSDLAEADRVLEILHRYFVFEE